MLKYLRETTISQHFIIVLFHCQIHKQLHKLKIHQEREHTTSPLSEWLINKSTSSIREDVKKKKAHALLMGLFSAIAVTRGIGFRRPGFDYELQYILVCVTWIN